MFDAFQLKCKACLTINYFLFTNGARNVLVVCVRQIFQHELTKLFLFIFLSFVGGALLAPHLYSWGKDLATAHGPFNGDPNFWDSPIVWLAEKCDSAKFERYFKRALMACAVLLLFPLIKSLRSKEKATEKQPLPQRINPGLQGSKDIGVGFLIAASFLMVLVVGLFSLGWIEFKEELKWGRAIQKALTTAIIVSLLEEWLFRGVLYDVLLRQLSVAKAIIGLSLFFAAVHFLMPPDGAMVNHPTHWLAGFEMIGLIGMNFLSPTSFLGAFLTLFVIGIILAYTRHKTGKLWFAVGLHAGWVFPFVCVNRLTDTTGSGSALWYNDSLREGLLPLITLSITGICIYFFLRNRNHCPPNS